MWSCAPGWRHDDLLLTILGTTPRVFLCLEWADGKDNGTEINVRESIITVPNGLSVNAVQDQLPFEIRAGRYYSGVQGDQLLTALESEFWSPSPWFAPAVQYPGPI
ncbi:hypothetical protein GCM10023094_09690 [Rhodococcus olei]|uniref:Uncharacterized protein n=1 Tax=Rhodococcus olei TaxID=2161675 RepID=A0ABP8NXU0_9NOCA